jgi:zinc/manganese transport system permease protein
MGEFSEFASLMFKPFLACLILTGIHAYLGIHVVERGVIFVDLALAQIAALGATIGFLLGFGLHSRVDYLFSLGFTFVGAAVFALTRFRKQRVPQEAIIGIVYAVSAAAAILILSRAPGGSEEIKEILVGNILLVDWPEIWTTLGIYSLVGFVHYLVRRPLLLISQNPQGALAKGMAVRWWDLLFYATFGLVVTSSVKIAGVLLVFSFLIVPAVCAVFLAESISRRLWTGWVLGALTSMTGVTLSYYLDLPTGATVVCVFGVLLALTGALKALVPRVSR